MHACFLIFCENNVSCVPWFWLPSLNSNIPDGFLICQLYTYVLCFQLKIRLAQETWQSSNLLNLVVIQSFFCEWYKIDWYLDASSVVIFISQNIHWWVQTSLKQVYICVMTSAWKPSWNHSHRKYYLFWDLTLKVTDF